MGALADQSNKSEPDRVIAKRRAPLILQTWNKEMLVNPKELGVDARRNLAPPS
jgi:hypothetical protein